jgi:SAM-dependent methyltransferase
MATSMWDERYGGEGFFYGTEPNDFLRAQAPGLPQGGKVLCLAEGEGRNAVFLAGLGHPVTAVDSSAQGLAKTRQLARQRGVEVETVLADLADWDPGPDSHDAVVSIWCHLPPELRRVVHARVLRCLRPGGVLVLEHYHPRQLGYGTGGPRDAALLLTLAELERDFATLEVRYALEGERVVKEGTGHSGRSFVTQFVAQRKSA